MTAMDVYTKIGYGLFLFWIIDDFFFRRGSIVCTFVSDYSENIKITKTVYVYLSLVIHYFIVFTDLGVIVDVNIACLIFGVFAALFSWRIMINILLMTVARNIGNYYVFLGFMAILWPMAITFRASVNKFLYKYIRL